MKKIEKDFKRLKKIRKYGKQLITMKRLKKIEKVGKDWNSNLSLQMVEVWIKKLPYMLCFREPWSICLGVLNVEIYYFWLERF